MDFLPERCMTRMSSGSPTVVDTLGHDQITCNQDRDIGQVSFTRSPASPLAATRYGPAEYPESA
jgi:hypothetical protein